MCVAATSMVDLVPFCVIASRLCRSFSLYFSFFCAQVLRVYARTPAVNLTALHHALSLSLTQALKPGHADTTVADGNQYRHGLGGPIPGNLTPPLCSRLPCPVMVPVVALGGDGSASELLSVEMLAVGEGDNNEGSRAVSATDDVGASRL